MKKNILFVSLIFFFVSSIVSKDFLPGLAQTSSTPIINIYNNIPTGSSGSVFSVFKFLVVAVGFWEGGARYFGVPEWGFFKKVFKPVFNWFKTQTKDQALRFANFLEGRVSSVTLRLFINYTIKPFIHWFYDSPFSVAQEIINVQNKKGKSDQRHDDASVENYSDNNVQPQKKNVKIPEKNMFKVTNFKKDDGNKNAQPLIEVEEKKRDIELNNQDKDANLLMNDFKPITNFFQPTPFVSDSLKKMHDPQPFPVLPDTNKSLSGVQKTGVSVFELPQKTFTDEFKEFQKKENVEKDVISSEMKKAWERINSVNYSEEYLKNTKNLRRFPKFCQLSFEIKKWLINYFRETAKTFLLKDRIGIDVKKFHKYMFNFHFCFETRPEFFLNTYFHQRLQLQNKIARL